MTDRTRLEDGGPSGPLVPERRALRIDLALDLLAVACLAVLALLVLDGDPARFALAAAAAFATLMAFALWRHGPTRLAAEVDDVRALPAGGAVAEPAAASVGRASVSHLAFLAIDVVVVLVAHHLLDGADIVAGLLLPAVAVVRNLLGLAWLRHWERDGEILLREPGRDDRLWR